jgi:hypothetical protein
LHCAIHGAIIRENPPLEAICSWLSQTAMHSSILTITFLVKESNSVLCCKDFFKDEIVFTGAARIAVRAALLLLGVDFL